MTSIGISALSVWNLLCSTLKQSVQGECIGPLKPTLSNFCHPANFHMYSFFVAHIFTGVVIQLNPNAGKTNICLEGIVFFAVRAIMISTDIVEVEYGNCTVCSTGGRKSALTIHSHTHTHNVSFHNPPEFTHPTSICGFKSRNVLLVWQDENTFSPFFSLSNEVFLIFIRTIFKAQ